MPHRRRPQQGGPRRRRRPRVSTNNMPKSWRLPVALGVLCAGMLSVFAFASKVADAINVPKRVDVLERGQETLTRRMDALSFDVQKIQTGMDSSFRIINDALARQESRATEGFANMKSLGTAIDEIRKESMRTSTKLDNLQVQQDQFQEHLNRK